MRQQRRADAGTGDDSTDVGFTRPGLGGEAHRKELEVARNTVKRYLAAGGYVPCQSPRRPGKLAGLADWIKEQFQQHRGNCDVVRQELARARGLLVMVARLLAAVWLAGAACFPALAAPAPLPPLMLWAWDRGDDLRFIDPRHTGVALLASTIHVDGPDVRVQRRRLPLRVPPGTRLLAVAHFKVRQPEVLALPRAVEAVLELAGLPRISGVQLDFEAAPSQRQFYRDLAAQVRQGLPPGLMLSATALASWCLFDRWLDPLPLDEVVPMAFSMGAGDGEVRARLAEAADFVPGYCRQSLGVSMQEPVPTLPGRRRIYAFNAQAWRLEDYQRLLAAIKLDHGS